MYGVKNWIRLKGKINDDISKMEVKMVNLKRINLFMNGFDKIN